MVHRTQDGGAKDPGLSESGRVISRTACVRPLMAFECTGVTQPVFCNVQDETMKKKSKSKLNICICAPINTIEQEERTE